MAKMAVSEARERLSEAVEMAHTEAVFLERYGRPAAVLVSPERYEELIEALEDAEDAQAFDAAMAEEGQALQELSHCVGQILEMRPYQCALDIGDHRHELERLRQ